MMCKVVGRFLDKNNLDSIINIIKGYVFYNNKLGINICACLDNLITSHGDQFTNRSNSKSLNKYNYI